jgi:hypothetical protein
MHQESLRLEQLRVTENLGKSNIEEDSQCETKGVHLLDSHQED